MCGIAGFTHYGRKPSPDVLRAATSSIRHRGPDQQGYFEAADVSIGAVRLKILDLGGGDQPITTEDGAYTIAFNGEIYNHAQIRAELEALGHKFRSHCDTEVVLRAFAQWDTDSFTRLRGMFAAALWDADEQRLVLVRDRLGIKPLYYALHHENLYFGSELKTLFAHPELPRNLCHEALQHYLRLNYIPEGLTMIEGIRKLAPGTWLEFRRGATQHGRYWTNRMRPESMALPDAVAELDRLLSDSVKEHLLSDVPLGVWASGGLDSSAILHYASQHSSTPLETYSLSFRGRECDESAYFQLLAEQYGTKHHELDINTDLELTDVIEQMAYFSDEPSADAGALPVWFLSKMSRSGVTVALSGEGADEIFGGYQTYIADQYSRVARRFPASLLRLGSSVASRLPVSDQKISLEYKLKRFLAGSLMPSDDAHFFWNGTFTGDDRPPFAFECETAPLSRVVERIDGVPSEQHVLNRYLFVDQHCYLPNDILYKCDRMSMAHSLEVRPPFLDHRIVEFAGRLPENLKIRGGQTKLVLRELMRNKLPRPLLTRKKEGLDIPVHDWFRGALKPLLLDVLGPANVENAGVFCSAPIQTLISEHLDRRANLGYHLWGLLTLHLWMKRWNVQVMGQPHTAAYEPVP